MLCLLQRLMVVTAVLRYITAQDFVLDMLMCMPQSRKACCTIAKNAWICLRFSLK